MEAARHRLISALLEPHGTLALDLREWDALLLAARERGLMGKLAARLADLGLFARTPHKAQRHLRAALIGVESSQTAVRYELNRVLRALGGLDVPIVLLKGAAYLLADLPPARGRFVGDLDLLVPRERISALERILTASGWAPAELDDYDQTYYRQWTHEIPPLQHPERETPIDIHHTIAPLTSRLHPDAEALLTASRLLADGRLRVLAPADMVLHSTIHLFNDEVGKPLRDLFDLHELLVHFTAETGFWDELLARAHLHGLGRPLYYMLRQVRTAIGTPIPQEVVAAAAAFAPPAPLDHVMSRLFAAHFRPRPGFTAPLPDRIAESALYVRAHWLRMPPGLLARHLAVKSVARIRERLAKAREEANP